MLKKSAHIRRFFLNTFVLLLPLLGLAFTSAAWNWSVRLAKADLQQKFDYRANNIQARIQARLLVYEQLLHSTRGLFLASQEVSRAEFKAFVSALNIQQHYPGIQGIGFSKLVPLAEKDRHIAAVRAEGFPDYTIRPEGDRPDFYTSIVYLEPFEKRNLRAFGYDMYSEAVRREAMSRAIDTDSVALSGKVKLVQENNEDVQAGFLLYLPLYTKNIDSNSIEQRRAHLLGWVYSPLRAKDFLNGIFADFSDVDIEIYDGDSVSADTLLFSSHNTEPLANPLFKTGKKIEFAGHNWTVAVHSHPLFEQQLDLERSKFIAITGIGSSFMLAIILSLLLDRRRKAEILAQKITAELSIKNIELHHYFEQPFDGMFTSNAAQNFINVNQRLCDMLGYSKQELLTTFKHWKSFTYPDDMELTPVYLEKLVSGELDRYQLQKRYLHKDGHIIYVDVSVSGIRNEQGQIEFHVGIIRDISETKLVEQRLRQSEERFRNTFEYAPIGVVNIGMDKRYLAVNQTFCDFLGYSREELLSMSVLDVTQPQDFLEQNQQIARLVNRQQSAVYMEKQYVRKDGSLVWGSLSIRISYRADGMPDYFIATVENIETRKKFELEILATKSQLEATLNAIPDLLFEVDATGRYINYHTNRPELLALEPTQLLGKNIAEVLPPAATAVCWDVLAEAMQQGWSTGKIFMLPLHGQEHWFELSAAPKSVTNGTLPHFIVLSRDVTERQLAEQTLRFHSNILQSMAEGVHLSTAADSRIVFVNPQLEQMFGYAPGELIGQHVSILNSDVDEPAQETANRIIAELQQTGVWHGDLQNVRKNGETFWCHASVSSFEHAQFGRVWVSVHTDITQSKLAELEMKKAEQLAIAANQAKSEFLANMSHEIRTPMNAILGFSDILSGLITDKVQRHYLAAISTSGKTLLQLINDILDLSKIEAGKLDLQYQPVSIKNIAEDIGVIFTQKFIEKDIDFQLLMPESLPPYLLMDEIRLRQVLLNLVGNAVKFTEQGFIRLTVSSAATRASQYLHISISVSDSGIGISPDQNEAIFSAFTQQKQQDYRFGGTGLGLTICKHLVEMMGGTISVESTLGAGSCFIIDLPQVEICQATKPVSTQAKLSRQTVHFQPAVVLAVDDIEANRLLIKSYLSDYPELELVEAETGAEALALATRQRFDLILMDKRLPDQTGDQVCKQIKALPEYAKVPIIMITASALVLPNLEQPLYYELQLNKPVNKAELLNAIQTFLAVDERSDIENSAVMADGLTAFEQNISAPKQTELVALLKNDYLQRINSFSHTGVLEIDLIIDTAEQLLAIAAQYQSQALQTWAGQLKEQAELFDLNSVPKTLTGFNDLLAQLDTV